MSQAPEGRPEIHEAIRALQQLAELFDLRRRQLASEVGIGEAQWRLLEEVAEEHFMPASFATPAWSRHRSARRTVASGCTG